MPLLKSSIAALTVLTVLVLAGCGGAAATNTVTGPETRWGIPSGTRY